MQKILKKNYNNFGQKSKLNDIDLLTQEYLEQSSFISFPSMRKCYAIFFIVLIDI